VWVAKRQKRCIGKKRMAMARKRITKIKSMYIKRSIRRSRILLKDHCILLREMRRMRGVEVERSSRCQWRFKLIWHLLILNVLLKIYKFHLYILIVINKNDN